MLIDLPLQFTTVSYLDTNRAEGSVPFIEVSLFQGVEKCMEGIAFGVGKGVLFSALSSFQRFGTEGFCYTCTCIRVPLQHTSHRCAG